MFLKLGLGAMIALPPSCDAVPWRALQVVLACPCEYCVGKGNTVADCESFGSDCSCYRGCPCATCVGKGNTVADCESFGSDCSCYRDPGPSACADFGGRTATVNDVCCNEKTEDCSSGRPATCNLGCAHVLLPFFDDCAGALGAAGAAQFDGVVALCRAAEAAPPVRHLSPRPRLVASSPRCVCLFSLASRRRCGRSVSERWLYSNWYSRS